MTHLHCGEKNVYLCIYSCLCGITTPQTHGKMLLPTFLYSVRHPLHAHMCVCVYTHTHIYYFESWILYFSFYDIYHIKQFASGIIHINLYIYTHTNIVVVVKSAEIRLQGILFRVNLHPVMICREYREQNAM